MSPPDAYNCSIVAERRGNVMVIQHLSRLFLLKQMEGVALVLVYGADIIAFQINRDIIEFQINRETF